MVAPTPKVVKKRGFSMKVFRVSSLDNGFSMPAKGLRALGRLLDIVALDGTMVKVTVERSTKGGD